MNKFLLKLTILTVFTATSQLSSSKATSCEQCGFTYGNCTDTCFFDETCKENCKKQYSKCYKNCEYFKKSKLYQ